MDQRVHICFFFVFSISRMPNNMSVWLSCQPVDWNGKWLPMKVAFKVKVGPAIALYLKFY